MNQNFVITDGQHPINMDLVTTFRCDDRGDTYIIRFFPHENGFWVFKNKSLRDDVYDRIVGDTCRTV